jgi:hypothetical protein
LRRRRSGTGSRSASQKWVVKFVVELTHSQIEGELLKAVEVWETEKERPFLANGERVIDTIENARAAKEAAKEAKRVGLEFRHALTLYSSRNSALEQHHQHPPGQQPRQSPNPAQCGNARRQHQQGQARWARNGLALRQARQQARVLSRTAPLPPLRACGDRARTTSRRRRRSLVRGQPARLASRQLARRRTDGIRHHLPRPLPPSNPRAG